MMNLAVRPSPGTLVARRLRLVQLALAAVALAIAVASGDDGIMFSRFLARAAALQLGWCVTVVSVEFLQLALTHPLWLRACTFMDWLTALAAVYPALGALGLASFFGEGDHCAEHQHFCSRFWSSAPKAFVLWLSLQAPSLCFIIHGLLDYIKSIVVIASRRR